MRQDRRLVAAERYGAPNVVGQSKRNKQSSGDMRQFLWNQR
jgi:hypothetical protein